MFYPDDLYLTLRCHVKLLENIIVSPQGNMQRCKLVMDQITEAREAMMKVLDHRERVLKLLNKNSSIKKLHKLHKRKDRA